MTTMRVSVVIPTRDNLDYLPKALNSVYAQGIAEMEVIVVDDGSQDGTAAWLEDFGKTHAGLRVFQAGGVGPSAARNSAISIARAPLIAFLDADDWWHPGKLSRQLAWLEQHQEVGFSFTDYMHIDPYGETYGTCYEYWKPDFVTAIPYRYDLVPEAEAHLLGLNIVGTSTVVARTALLRNANGFANAVRSAEDWDLWLRLANLAPVAATSMVTTSYLMRPGSVTGNREARIAAMEGIIERYCLRREVRFREAIRQAQARVEAAKADIARIDGDSWGAMLAELRALAHAPTLRNARAAASDMVKGLRRAVDRSAA